MTESSPQPYISESTVRTSGGLFRATSQILTGGADGLHHDLSLQENAVSESTPLVSSDQQAQPNIIRQESAASMRQALTPDQVQEQIRQDAMDAFRRNWGWILAAGILFVVAVIVGIVMFFLALVAVLVHHQKPCDQPLKWYLLTSFFTSQFVRIIQESSADCRMEIETRLALSAFLALPGWCIMGWGFYMIQNAETCPKSNPDLFYPTQAYIYVQITFAWLGVIVGVLAALGWRRFCLYASRLLKAPGCEKAVQEFPKIPSDSKELIDENGEILGCPICMESLSDGGVAVRTPCTHYFHYQCLATWCANHLQCPLCRQELGPPDGGEKEGFRQMEAHRGVRRDVPGGRQQQRRPASEREAWGVNGIFRHLNQQAVGQYRLRSEIAYSV